MSDVRRGRVKGAWLFAAVALLAGCGGGGGDAPAPAPSAVDSSGPLALNAANAADVATLSPSAGELVLQFAQVAVDGASRRLSSPTSQTQACANGGLVTTTLIDNDGNGVVSANDRVTIELRDCGMLLMGTVLSGTVVIDLAAAGAGPPATLRGEVSLGNGIAMTPPSGPVPGVTLAMEGSWSFQWSEDAFRTELTVTSSSADDLRLTGTGSSGSVTERFRALSVSKALHRDEARSIVQMLLRHESELLGGSIVLSTPQALTSYLNTYPESGQLEARGADAAVVRIRPNFVLSSDQFIVELDSNGDGRPEASASMAWTNAILGYLWWDGRAGLTWAAMPYQTQPFSTTAFSYAVTSSDPNGVNSEYRVQFTRPPAANTTLQFRFRDMGSTTGYDPEIIDVAADVDHRGALYVVRSRQSLRHGRTYSLDASADGVNWFNTQVGDTLGNLVSIGFVTTIATPDTMRAKIVASGGTLSSAAAVIELDAGSSFSARPIAGYQWRQLSGTPLVLSAPQSAQTQLHWGSVVPTTLDNCVFELTITDTAGDRETTRISIAVYQPASVTRLLHFRSAAGDYIGAGQTVTVSDTTGTFGALPANTGGVITFGYSETNFISWWNLSLAGANGVPLTVGVYADARRAAFAGANNGLDFYGSGRGCNQVFGRFKVLELQTDPGGAINKIAVDFEQHCESADAPPLFGSLRINSLLPITQ